MVYAFIIPVLTSTLLPGINYFVVTTHPPHQLQVRLSVLVCSPVHKFFDRTRTIPRNASTRDKSTKYKSTLLKTLCHERDKILFHEG